MDQENAKIIENDSIRHHFDEKTKEWYFSIVDTVGIITESSDSRNYWKVLKSRLKKEQNQLVTKCNQLKMLSSDGKLYLTDVGDKKTILQIIKLVSPEFLLPLKLYFEKIDQETPSHFNFSQNSSSSKTEEEDSYPHLEEKETESELFVDGYQTKDSVVIKVMIASVSPEDILIYGNHETITIKGKRTKPKNILGVNIPKDYLRQELYWGKFSRTITLPVEVEIDTAVTTYQYGLLTIEIKKVDRSLTKIIEIKSL